MPRLAWALVGDGDAPVLAPVTRYAGLPSSERPRARCPLCLERVVLKLGRRLRHHYAHRADSSCPAAGGEGALHLGAKIRLAEILRERSRDLLLRRLCARLPELRRSGTRCPSPPPHPWLVEWDEVRLEHALPAIRADILLLRDGRPVGAVEIRASHAVDDEKAERYRGLGVPWIEVPAAAVARWRADSPLPVLADSELHPRRWRCAHHEALHRGALELARNGTHLSAGRVVHLYRADGGRSTGEPRCRGLVVYMVERREEGVPVEGWLERGDTGARLGAPVRHAEPEALRLRLHARFREWVAWLRSRDATQADSPMRWAPPAALEGWKRSGAFPERFRWDARTGRFVAPPNLPGVSWPRVPARERGAPDPILGHPECLWGELHPDGTPVLHAVVGHGWVTLRTRGRDDEEEVAHLAAHLHDGRGWRVVPGAPFVVARRVEAHGSAAWEQTLLAVGRELAARPVGEALASFPELRVPER